jgi:LysM repeat protein
VKRGETLGGIAKRYRTSTAALMRLNGLRKRIIIPGQRLVVKGRSQPARASTSRVRKTRSAAKRSSSTQANPAVRETQR